MNLPLNLKICSHPLQPSIPKIVNLEAGIAKVSNKVATWDLKLEAVDSGRYCSLLGSTAERGFASILSTRLFSTTEADEVLVSEKSVKASISLASLAHEASKSNNGVLGAGHLSVFINLQKA